MKKIGFIGLGNMGGRVANAILRGGYAMTVYDLNEKAMAQFEGRASLATDEIDVLENSDIILLSLPSSKIVEPIINKYLAHGLNGKIIIDASTSHPLVTRRLYKEVKEAGGNLVDLPLSGAPVDADSAKLLALFGGDENLFEELRPLISTFANRYANLGPSGNGHVTKLIFNFVAMNYVSIYAMAFALTEKLGLDNNQLFDLLMTTGMGCGTGRFYIPKMINKTYDMAFALELAHKDMCYVKSMFEEYQVPAYILDGTLDLMRTTIRDGKGKDDYSTIISTMFDFFEKK